MATAAQLLAIKNEIANDPVLAAKTNNPDGNDSIAALLNLSAALDFWVYRTAIKVDEIGDAIDATELVSLTTAKLTQLQTLLLFGALDASRPNRRAALAQIFNAASGTITRPALESIARRKATRIEKLLATGIGSTASPATMGLEGIIRYQDIEQARNS